MATLAHALATARPRWDDPAYATRICISQIVGADWDSETGYGITIDSLCDNEHSVPVVNWNDQNVSLYKATWSEAPDFNDPKFTMGLEAFVSKFSKNKVAA